MTETEIVLFYQQKKDLGLFKKGVLLKNILLKVTKYVKMA